MAPRRSRWPVASARCGSPRCPSAMVLSLRTVKVAPLRPTRAWRNKTGPPSSEADQDRGDAEDRSKGRQRPGGRHHVQQALHAALRWGRGASRGTLRVVDRIVSRTGRRFASRFARITAVPHRLELLPPPRVGQVSSAAAPGAVVAAPADQVRPAVEPSIGPPVAGLEGLGGQVLRLEHRVAGVVIDPSRGGAVVPVGRSDRRRPCPGTGSRCGTSPWSARGTPPNPPCDRTRRARRHRARTRTSR